MKRRDFFQKAGLGVVAAAAAPVAMAQAAEGETVFVHDPIDYAFVPEEDEEFQEYEIDVPDDWAEEEIIWE